MDMVIDDDVMDSMLKIFFFAVVTTAVVKWILRLVSD